jgi:hypothetical protein
LELVTEYLKGDGDMEKRNKLIEAYGELSLAITLITGMSWDELRTKLDEGNIKRFHIAAETWDGEIHKVGTTDDHFVNWEDYRIVDDENEDK